MTGHGALQPRQFHQLPMFVTAETLRDVRQTIPLDFGHLAYHWDEEHQMRALDAHWRHKKHEADQRSLTRRVEEHGGVIEPVLLTQDRHVGERPELSDGHHRTAVAYARNPKSLLPVRHQVRG